MIKHVVFSLVALAAIILAAAWIAAAHRAQQAHDQQQRFLQWETCVLNDQPNCGPQPVP